MNAVGKPCAGHPSDADFAGALLDPNAPPPPGLCAPAGASVASRYAIYRNNVASSLADALEQGFPVLRALLGNIYFRALAGEFLRVHPPGSPILSCYGADLPDFVDAFPPLASRPWLGDVARLELLRRESSDAPDQPPLAAAQFEGTDPETLMNLIPQRHPSARWLASPWPVHTIWRTQSAAASDTAEAVLLVRPALLVSEYRLPAGGIEFLEAMDGWNTLAAIVSKTLDLTPTADIPGLLTLLVRSGALSQLNNRPTPARGQ